MQPSKVFFSQQLVTPSPLRSFNESAGAATKKATGAADSFEAVLQGQMQELHFSQHAQQRLAQRGIELSSSQTQRLKSAVQDAAQKGGREALVLVDSLAFVVSVRNETVITAMEGDGVKSHVFTNIDSAVIA